MSRRAWCRCPLRLGRRGAREDGSAGAGSGRAELRRLGTKSLREPPLRILGAGGAGARPYGKEKTWPGRDRNAQNSRALQRPGGSLQPLALHTQRREGLLNPGTAWVASRPGETLMGSRRQASPPKWWPP